MKMSCSWTPVLALAGLAALGWGGYNMMSTGCPLGTCCDSATTAATVTPAAMVAAPEKADCCAEKTECCADKAECCQGKTAAECTKTAGNHDIVKTASFDSAAAGECTAKTECTAAKTECTAAKTECTKDVAKSCEGKTECQASKVADKGTTETPIKN